MSTVTVPARARTSGGGGAMAGVGTLVRFLLRRDLIKLPAWVVGHGLFVLYIGSALPQIAPNKSDLESMVVLFAQPVGRMFTGPAFGMDDPTYERFFAAGYAPYLFILAALMNIMLVTRHTRVEEQTGRAELLRANVTGRYAALTACLIVAVITDVLAGIVVTGLAIGVGFAPAGSVLVGVGTGLTGLAFAGVTAVTAQLSEYSRSAAGVAGVVLGAAFVLRAFGDMAHQGGSALSWASPLGWPAQTAPYVNDRWAPLLPLVGFAAVMLVAAYLLLGRRDFGASLLAVRPGSARAGRALGSPFGLAARVQRGAMFGWGGALLLLGIVDGAFAQALKDAGANMPATLKEVLGSGALTDAYLGFLGSFVSVLVAAYAVFAAQTLRTEESRGRTEAVLAASVGRRLWLGSHAIAVAIGAIVISVVAGLGTGVAAGAATGDSGVIADALAAHVSLIPAVLLVAGFCVALVGWLPRLVALLGWALVALSAIVAFFADLLDLPDWLTALSPFHHLALVPQEQFALGPFVVVLVLAVVLGSVGLIGISRRQINVV